MICFKEITSKKHLGSVLAVLEMCPDSWSLSEHGWLCSLLCVFMPMHLLSVTAHGEGKTEDDTTEQQLRGERFSLTNAEEEGWLPLVLFLVVAAVITSGIPTCPYK